MYTQQTTAPAQTPQEHEHHVHQAHAPKKFSILFVVLIGIGAIIVLVGLVVLLLPKNQSQTASIQNGVSPTAIPTPETIPLTQTYSNPFDEQSSSENPFSNDSEASQNPFDGLQ